MFCKYCGKEVDDKAVICVHCGRKLSTGFSGAFEESELTRLRPQPTPKSPGLAGFIGFVLGWLFLGPFGYVYLGQWNWFWITLVITVIAYPLTIGIAYVLFPFVFAFHQYQMARELNAMIEPKSQSLTETPPSKPDGES